MSHWRKLPRDSGSFEQNLTSQPLRHKAVFGRSDLLTAGWYPVLKSAELGCEQVRSVVLHRQRIAVFRGRSGRVSAIDAFCPHMGADLGNGCVVGEQVECYFHRWRFAGTGELASIHCDEATPRDVKLQSYPVHEKFGAIWVYAGTQADHEVIQPPGLPATAECEGWWFGTHHLFAHHHVLMVGSIDLQHFSTVHDLDIEFDFKTEERENGSRVIDWQLQGKLPRKTFKHRLLRTLLGDDFRYTARFSGGSAMSITYGKDQRLFGRGPRLPELHIVWGAIPRPEGSSKVAVFIVTRKYSGLLAWPRKWAMRLLTLALLIVLRDDDVKAFPNMRFQVGRWIRRDESAAQLVAWLDRQPRSDWTPSS